METNANRKIKKSYKNLPQTDLIRMGNNFVDDFMFSDGRIEEIPINALRVIFNVVSDLRNQQMQPVNNARQLSLFEEEFETENNTFAQMKIKNDLISTSGTEIKKCMKYLVHFREDWYESVNSKGKKIKTYGGLISLPSYDERGYTSFLVSSFWLKKLMVIPEYNPVLYNLVYNIRSNKHILFALWLERVPKDGTTLSLETFNEKFRVNYADIKHFCQDFLKPIRLNLDKFSRTSFNYRAEGNKIHILPYPTKTIQDNTLADSTKEAILIRQRLRYFQKRHDLTDKEMEILEHHYKNILQDRKLIESAYKLFIEKNRAKKIKSTDFKNETFLSELQNKIIEIYQNTKIGKQMPLAYPKIF